MPKNSAKESYIQKQILRYLRDNFREAYIVKLSDKFVSGVPDICMIHDSVAYFFEVKTPTGKPTKLQLYTIERLKKAGAIAEIVTSTKEVRNIV